MPDEKQGTTQTVTPETDRAKQPFTCPWCGDKFGTIERFTAHLPICPSNPLKGDESKPVKISPIPQEMLDYKVRNK